MNKKIRWIMMAYDQLNDAYIEVGNAIGETSKEAKETFIEETDWKDSPGVILFAKYPICK